MNTTGYRPVYLLGDFIERSAKSHRFWIAEDLMVLSLIALGLFEEHLGIHFFREDRENHLQVPGRILAIGSVLIWQLWGVVRSLETISFARVLLEKSVVLDCRREVARLGKFLALEILFVLAHMAATVLLAFVPGFEDSHPLIVLWPSVYASAMMIRFLCYVLLHRCNRTANWRGNWESKRVVWK